jgi:hypothetical protein
MACSLSWWEQRVAFGSCFARMRWLPLRGQYWRVRSIAAHAIIFPCWCLVPLASLWVPCVLHSEKKIEICKGMHILPMFTNSQLDMHTAYGVGHLIPSMFFSDLLIDNSRLGWSCIALSVSSRYRQRSPVVPVLLWLTCSIRPQRHFSGSYIQAYCEGIFTRSWKCYGRWEKGQQSDIFEWGLLHQQRGWVWISDESRKKDHIAEQK